MAEMTTILVPLDGSDFSRSALDALARVFEPERCRLVLFRVGSSPPSVGGPPRRRRPMPSELMLEEPEEETHVWDSQEWESSRQALRDEISPDVRRLEREGWRVELATAFGDPADEIVAYGEREHVDLVVMATHGRTGLARVLLGSVAERVLRGSHVPVLMVRPEELRGDGAGEGVDATP